MSTVNTTNYLHSLSKSGTSTVFLPSEPQISFVSDIGDGYLPYFWHRFTNPDTVPGYRDLIRRGYSASTELEAWRVLPRCTNGIVSQLSHHSFNPNLVSLSALKGAGFMGFDLTTPILSDETTRQKALQKFLEQYRSNISQIMGGVFLAELRQTISLITHPGRIIRSGLDDYLRRAKNARRVIKNPKRLKNFLSSSWLEYRFGIQPLLQDIEGAAHALSNIYYERRSRVALGSTSSLNWSSDTEFGRVNVAGLAMYPFEHSEFKLSYHYYGSMWLDTGSPTQAISSLGFSPLDWLPTVWELIPYSFVVDYFTNIGDLINSYSYGTTQIVWSSLTTRCERVSTRYPVKFHNIDPVMVVDSVDTSNLPKSVVTATYVRRAVNPDLAPSFQLKLPGMGSSRWINLAALIAQQGRDRSQRL